MPKNAGLQVYKVDKITVRSTVSTVVVESSFFKKSPTEFQTTLLVLDSESILVNIEVVDTISIDSTLIGGEANEIHLMSSVTGKIICKLYLSMKYILKTNKYICIFCIKQFFFQIIFNIFNSNDFQNHLITGKILMVEFDFVSKLHYENGELVVFIGNSEVIAFKSKLNYNEGVLEASNGIKFHNSDLVLLNSKLVYDKNTVEFTTVGKYHNTAVFSANLQQTLDIKNLAFNAEVCL